MSLTISRVLSWTVIHLGRMSPYTSSDLPGSSVGHAFGPLFGLAPSGVFHRHGLLPAMRCALTAPFQPYRSAEANLGGILSVALSVDSRRPGVTWHFALWSPDFPPSSYLPKGEFPNSDCLSDSARRLASYPNGCKRLLTLQHQRLLV